MKRIIKRIVIVAAILISVILFTELFLRCTCKRKLSRWNAMVYVPDSILGYRYYPDTTFIISNVAFTNSCTTNSLGFPGDEFSPKKKEGVFRILVIGASDDTGFNSNGSYNYVQRLNKMFHDRNYPVEIINCSTDGSDRIVRDIEFIKKEGILYEPDLVLLRNQLPFKDVFRYRVTYKGNIITSPGLSGIEPTKKYIDDVLVNKKYWFKIYDWSYIFRYYLKIYFDKKKNDPGHKFVYYSDVIFGYKNLRYLSMYVRREVRFVPTIGFNIDIFEKNKRSQSIKTYNPSDFNYLTSFNSGTKDHTWIDVDLTNYVKSKQKRDTLELLFNTELSKSRTIAFTTTDKFAPQLNISRSIGDTIIFPFESETIGFDNSIKKDSVTWICNDRDSTKSRITSLKFDISKIQSFEKCKLKLYVNNLSLGEKVVIDHTYSLAESADSLKSLQNFLEVKGIQLYLLDTYSSPTKYDKSFAKHQINYINLDIPFKQEYSFGALDGHSTQAGHQAIAEALFEKLLKIVPQQYLMSKE